MRNGNSNVFKQGGLLSFPVGRFQGWFAGCARQVLGTLRPLLPRLYSISSSMREGPTQVQVTVAEVRYNSLGVDRIGVTSTYLSDRVKVSLPSLYLFYMFPAGCWFSGAWPR